MSYKYALKFLPSALKEWRALDNSIRKHLKRKLLDRLNHPEVASCRLRGFRHHYKIKLRNSGYRLVYEVLEDEPALLVIAVGRRDKSDVYRRASQRRDSP